MFALKDGCVVTDASAKSKVIIPAKTRYDIAKNPLRVDRASST